MSEGTVQVYEPELSMSAGRYISFFFILRICEESRLTGNSDTLVGRGFRAPLQLQRDSAAGGGSPLEGGALASSQAGRASWVGKSVLSSSESGEEADSDGEELHFCIVFLSCLLSNEDIEGTNVEGGKNDWRVGFVGLKECRTTEGMRRRGRLRTEK